ncbi:MAG: DNRLRE domain-containing protein [Actinomycetota bacterium]|nr:DNRLRE domain-containing protein [Actinomycetota bacterium]
MGQPSVANAVIITSTYPAAKDATIRQDSPTRNYGVDTQLEVQSRSGARNRRSLAQFDLSSIPAGSTIESVWLRLFLQNLPNNQRTYGVHRVTNSWLEGTGNGDINSAAINGATWRERQYGNNNWTGTGPWDWAAQGGDFLAPPTASTPTVAGWMSWNVLTDVAAWVSGAAANFGWLIKDAVENSGNRQRGRFGSAENGTAAERPALDVTYLRADSALSTATVPVGWYGQVGATFSHNGGAGADQVHQVSFVIPAGWSNISTATAGYTVTAPAGKAWNVTAAPSGPDGPQTVTVTAVNGAADLADGETVSIIFNAMAPWLSGNSVWPFTAFGAAGGTNIPASRTVDVTGTTLDFTPSLDTSLAPMTLSGTDSSTTGNLGALNVRDGRGAGGGWSVAIVSTDFKMAGNPAMTIPAGGFWVPTAPAVDILSGAAPPATAAGSLAGAGLTLMNASAGSGMGHYEVSPALELLVPAQTLSGTYESTMTETIIGL